MRNKIIGKVKRLASQVFNVGANRIKIIDPKKVNDKTVATKEDIRQYYKEGLIKIKPVKGTLSKKVKQKISKKPRRRGKGSLKGSKNTRIKRKQSHMKKIRVLRSYLKELILTGALDKQMKNPIYLKIKGGQFKSKRALYTYLKDNGLLKETGKQGV
jgi:large subunit ribosomal protein L19e